MAKSSGRIGFADRVLTLRAKPLFGVLSLRVSPDLRGAAMSKKEPLQGVDPTKPFFLALSIGYLDGSREELASEGYEGEWDTAEEAIRALREVNESYPGLTGYAYHCIPIAKVWRGKVRVTKLGNTK